MNEYYDVSEHREIRSDLTFAIDLVELPKVAIDCGCGAGADIAYLIALGYKVYGFDIEEEAILRCQKRFENSSEVILSKASFSSYSYPKASLVVADASLFFCPNKEFHKVWGKLYDSLEPGGVFCGSFLGIEDTMAKQIIEKGTLWPNRLVFDEQEVMNVFEKYKIHRFTEHKTSGKTLQGIQQKWHIYSVVAQKIRKSS